ncbi:MAG: hypothetical protein H0U74_06195 [Bradymonadaceae bacterium]|nr:hypothetical protein [Lujinxingiaceae bacterium]
MTTVGLVGKGVYFEVLTRLFEAASTKVLFWQPAEDTEGVSGKLPKHVKAVELEQMGDVALIFYSVPMHLTRAVGRRLGDVISGRQVVVHTSRSLEMATLKSVSQVLQEETPTQRFGFLSGPTILADIQSEKPAAGVCASLFPEVHDLVEDSLMSQRFRVYRTNDLAGAEVSAAYGRVLAMIAGLCQGLDLGTSLQATLFTRGLSEMSRFVVYRGGYDRTAYGFAGAGNLYADTHMAGSNAFRIGAHLAGLEHIDNQAIRDKFGEAGHDLLGLLESLHTVAQMAELELHILRGAQAIVSGQLSPSQAVQHLMALPALYE